MARRPGGPLVLLTLLAFLVACGGAPAPTPTAIIATATPASIPTAIPATPTSAPPPPPTVAPTAVPPSPTPVVRPNLVIGTPAATAAGEQFADPRGRFTFTQPKGWIPERQADPDVVVQLNSDRPPGSFTVATEAVPPGLLLAQYVEAGVAQVRKGVAGYEPGPRGSQATALGNEPAGLIDYFTTAGGTKLYFVQIITVKGDMAYVLTFNTQPADIAAYFNQAQVVLDSWRFL